MSWGTSFVADIYISRAIYNKIEDLNEAIDNLNESIDKLKVDLKNLAISTPKSITPDEYEPLEYVNFKVEDIIELYEDYTIRLYKLELLRDNFSESIQDI